MSEALLVEEQRKYERIRERHPTYGFGERQARWLADRGNPFCEAFLDTISRDEVTTALDVGCAGGTVMDLVSPAVEVEGIDIFPQAAAARPDLQIHHMNAARMSFPDDSFDVVYHLDGMEHIPAEVERAVLDEEFRVARRYVFHEIALVPSARDAQCLAEGLTPLHVNLKSTHQWQDLISEIADRRGFRLLLRHDEKRPLRGRSLLGTLGQLIRAVRSGRRAAVCLVYGADG